MSLFCFLQPYEMQFCFTSHFFYLMLLMRTSSIGLRRHFVLYLFIAAVGFLTVARGRSRHRLWRPDLQGDPLPASFCQNSSEVQTPAERQLVKTEWNRTGS